MPTGVPATDGGPLWPSDDDSIPNHGIITYPMRVVDAFDRPLSSLRLSVTDRCNLRCQYCMPETDYVWLPRPSLLTFEEIARVVEAFTGLGVAKVRLTGGEPLLRQELPALIELLAVNRAIQDLALTTNGVLLAQRARALREAGLHRITVSLDTLEPNRFVALTRFDSHAAVLAGIDAAVGAGFESVKLDTVVIRGINDDELPRLIEFGRQRQIEVRFIEYMDVGGATRWSTDAVVPRREMLELADETVRTDSAGRRTELRAGRPVHTAGRHRVRHHLLDDRAVLPILRSQPTDGRRTVVPVSVRADRHRSANAAARRRVDRRASRAHHVCLAGAR